MSLSKRDEQRVAEIAAEVIESMIGAGADEPDAEPEGDGTNDGVAPGDTAEAGAPTDAAD